MLAKKFVALKIDGQVEKIAQMIHYAQFRPCEPSEITSCGFVKVFETDDDIVKRSGSTIAFSFRTDKKSIPGGAVKEQMKEKIKEFEQKEGRKPKKDDKAEIKENIIAMIAAKTVASPSFVFGWFDLKENLMIICDTSDSKISNLVNYVTKKVSEVSISPIFTNDSPGKIMTNWVQEVGVPNELTVDDSAKFRIGEDGKASISNISLSNEQLIELSKSGECVELGVTVDGELSLNVESTLKFKKLKYIGQSSLDKDMEIDARFNAEMFLNQATTSKLIHQFVGYFGGLQTRVQ